MFANDEWLSQVTEEIVDPKREIVDPHHHLWDGPPLDYGLSHLWGDTQSGHNVTQTVFMECGSDYLSDGPEHLRPVGETLYIARAAAESAKDKSKATISALVAHADLYHPDLDAILDAHEAAANGLFRGIRHSGAWDPNPEAFTIPFRGVEGQYLDPKFQSGVARLGERGLTYDTWHYHPQNQDYLRLARAVPSTTMILDHFGTPLGIGQYAGKRDEIFKVWKDDIAAIAECPNVNAKIGGLAMPDNGIGWMGRDLPPTSDEFVEDQARYYHHAIKCFGPDRCMFESNFPVDRLSVSYHVMWNGIKKIAAQYSDAEQNMMFSGTARKIYRL